MKPVELFVTCMVDAFRPTAGIAAVRVLERRGAEVRFPQEQTCCGQFSYNGGYHHEAAQLARHFVAVFESSDHPIVALSGSCAAMVIHEYPSLIAEDVLSTGGSKEEAADWKHRAEQVGLRAIELSQWITQQRPEGAAASHDAKSATSVVLHQGCHMRRLLKANAEPEAALRQSGIQPLTVGDEDQCCGFGGTYSMTEWKVSTALADAKWDNIKKVVQEHAATCLTSADLGCLLHLEGRQSRLGETFPVLYLAEVIDQADQQEKGGT
ncbi:MAG: (Fe-S)-binding protein [Firmicutes bacterium]|nr:(Fe-S)-binding protein [Bacillota bacterium]